MYGGKPLLHHILLLSVTIVYIAVRLRMIHYEAYESLNFLQLYLQLFSSFFFSGVRFDNRRPFFRQRFWSCACPSQSRSGNNFLWLRSPLQHQAIKADGIQ